MDNVGPPPASPLPPPPTPSSVPSRPTAKGASKGWIVFGIVLLLLGTIVGFFAYQLFALTVGIGITTTVEADGEARLDARSYQIDEPSRQKALQLIITDESGQQLEIEEDFGDMYGDYEVPRVVFDVEQAGTITFDSDGEPITISENRGPNGYAALMVIVAAIGFFIALALFLPATMVLGVQMIKHVRSST